MRNYGLLQIPGERNGLKIHFREVPLLGDEIREASSFVSLT